MTLVALPAPLILAPLAGCVPYGGVIGTALGSDVGTFLLNGAGDKMAIVFQAPSSTVPDLIAFHVSTATTPGSAGTLDATLETLDTTGLPNGAVTNSATGSATISTTGVKTIAGLAGTAVVTAGTLYAIVLTAGSGWNRNLTVKPVTGSGQGSPGFPYYLTKDSAGAWAKVAGNNMGLCFGLANVGGVYLQVTGLLGAYQAVAFQTFTDASGVDERGNRFTLAAPMTLCGALALDVGGSVPDATNNATLSLYSSHTATPVQLATMPLPGASRLGFLGQALLFGTPVNLLANTVYALTLKATAAGNQNYVRWDYASNAHLGSFVATSFYSTSRDGGSGEPAVPGNNFTDLTTSVYGLFPLFSKIDDGAGAAGGGIRLAGHGGLAA